MADALIIGYVDSAGGSVALSRDGTTLTDIQAGDPIFQDDLIETGDGGLITIIFQDGSSLAMGDDSAMVIDELIYDPASGDGSSVMSALNGIMAFVSGDIAAQNPGATVLEGPVATIGIRGTTTLFQIDADGLTITLRPDADGTVGALSIDSNFGSTILDQVGLLLNQAGGQPTVQTLPDDAIFDALGGELGRLLLRLATEAHLKFLQDGSFFGNATGDPADADDDGDTDPTSGDDGDAEESAGRSDGPGEGVDADDAQAFEIDPELFDEDDADFGDIAPAAGPGQGGGPGGGGTGSDGSIDLGDLDPNHIRANDVPGLGPGGEIVDGPTPDIEVFIFPGEEELPDGILVDLNGPETEGAGFTSAFTEGGPAAAVVDPDAAVINGPTLLALRITMINNPDGAAEFLAVDMSGAAAALNIGVGELGVEIDPASTSTFINLLGVGGEAAPLDHFEAVLRTLTYSNTSDAPTDTGDDATRTVEVIATDEVGESLPTFSTISITPVNDPPVNSGIPGGLAVDEDGEIAINGLSVSDPDAGAGEIKVTLSVTDGGVTVADTSGLTSIDGNGTDSVELVGTVDAINAVLGVTDNIVYTPAADFFGDVTFTMLTDDQGNTPAPPESDSDGFTITVSAVNDAPVAKDDAYTVAEDSGTTALASVMTRVDAGEGSDDSDVDDAVPGDMTVTAVRVGATVITDGGAGDTDTVDGTISFATANGSVVMNTATGTFDYTPDDNFNGVDSFDYKISDGDNESDFATVTVTVSAVNDAPVAKDDEYTVAEDSGTTALASVMTRVDTGEGTDDSDVDNAVPGDMTVSAVRVGATVITDGGAGDTDAVDGTITFATANGSVLMNTATGTFDYTPDANFNGVDSFDYKISDGESESDFATVTLTVTAVNDPPKIDLDADDSTSNVGSTRFVTAFTEGGDAVAIADSDTEITDVDDTNIESATITLTNAKAGDELTIDDGSLPAGISVQTNTGTSIVLTGSASLADYQDAVQLISFNNDSEAPDTTTREVEVVVNDGDSDSNTATAFIQFTDINDAPVARGDAYTVAEDSGTTALASVFTRIDAGEIDGDDFDLDDAVPGDMTVTAVRVGATVITDGGVGDTDTVDGTISFATANGSVVMNTATGTFDYTPDANFNGADSFDYKISDGDKESDFATVTVTVSAVNDAPVAKDDAYTVAEDSGTTALSSVMTRVDGGEGSDDSDVDDAVPDDMTVSAVRVGATVITDGGVGDTDTVDGTITFATANGSVVMNTATGAFDYTPDANFNGIDSFDYKISDGDKESDFATVTVTVSAVNDAPVAKDDAYTVTEDSGTTALASVMTRVDAGEGSDDSDVDDAVPGDMTVTAVRVGATVITDGGVGDTDTVDGTISFATANGSVVMNTATGAFDYTPDANFNGADSFDYKISDGDKESDFATVTVTVSAVNDAPVAKDDAYTVAEDSGTTALASVMTRVDAGEGSDDSDVDDAVPGDMTVTAVRVGATVITDGGAGDTDTVDGTISFATANGSVVMNTATGTFDYTPDANFNGFDSFDYKISDGQAESDFATVTVTVDPVNDPAISDPDKTIWMPDGNLLDGEAANDPVAQPLSIKAPTDADADQILKIVITSVPSDGTLTYKLGGDGADVIIDDSFVDNGLKLLTPAELESITYMPDGDDIAETGTLPATGQIFSYDVMEFESDGTTLVAQTTGQNVAFNTLRGGDPFSVLLIPTGANDVPVTSGNDFQELLDFGRDLGSNSVGNFDFTNATIDDGDTMTLNGFVVTFGNGNDVAIGGDLNETIINAVNFLNQSKNKDLKEASYFAADADGDGAFDGIDIVHDDIGPQAAGSEYTLATDVDGAVLSGAVLTPGTVADGQPDIPISTISDISDIIFTLTTDHDDPNGTNPSEGQQELRALIQFDTDGDGTFETGFVLKRFDSSDGSWVQTGLVTAAGVPIWQFVVDLTVVEAKDVNEFPNATELEQLKFFLENNPPDAATDWQFVYEDDVPGNEQARFANVEITFNASGSDAVNADGTDGLDLIYGGIDADILDGNSGDDVIFGELGDDLIVAGAGNDVMTGNASSETSGSGGADTFVIDAHAPGDVNVITDFNTAEGDVLKLSDLFTVDTGTGSVGDFLELRQNPDDASATDVFIDKDGGGDNFVQVATLNGVSLDGQEETLVTNGDVVI